MKKLMTILLILLSGLSFTYEIKEGGLYIFNIDEFEALFGPNKACQLSATVMFNNAIVLQMKKKGTVTDVSYKELDRQLKIVDKFIKDTEDWDVDSNSWKNLTKFYYENCPKTIERTARKIIGKENMVLIKRNGMTKIFRGDRKGRLDKYGVYWLRKCETNYEVTYKGNTVVNRRPVAQKCYDVRETDI